MKEDATILITGGHGLVGTALKNKLLATGYTDVVAPSSKECDLTDFQATKELFKKTKPDYVFHLAAAVFGIMGNMKQKGISFLNNTLINTYVIEASREANVKKIVAMGTGCVYPYPPPSLPLSEEVIWAGPPHPSEDSYAHSKRAMLAQLNSYKESYGLDSAFVISGNLYGPYDKFDPEYGHVTPALVRKFYEAKRDNTPVSVWGNGSAIRDFLYVDDVATALLSIMDHLEGPINMGSGILNSIRDIVDILAMHTNMVDQVTWDANKPNGQEYRAYNLDKLFSTGFKATVSLEQGVRMTYDWYAKHANIARK